MSLSQMGKLHRWGECGVECDLYSIRNTYDTYIDYWYKYNYVYTTLYSLTVTLTRQSQSGLRLL